MEYIEELHNKIRSASSASEEEINKKTLHCLITIENYIESHISQDSEKLDDLKLKDDMKAILKENNSYDIAQCLKIMDRKIAKDNKTEAQLGYTLLRYISKVLEDASSPRQIGRIWA
ncbi:MAG: hypothetical protein QNJ32_06270 [Xenococcaceae cyanobacterium MO_167.B27]|nr:hypothetical protein [Xenococcaceae cyanobacterium MO_167.B27]